jgi:hypothetical protein
MGIRIVPDDQAEWSEALRREVDRLDAGGDGWEGTVPVPEAERPHFKRPMEKVIPIRVSAEQWKAFRAEAERLGIGPTTLVRMWALEKLQDSQAARAIPSPAQ